MPSRSFVEDLAAAREFYQRVFGLPIHFEDSDSAVFNFGNTVINLLAVSQAPELITPAKVAGPRPARGCSSPSRLTTWTPWWATCSRAASRS